MSQELYTYIQQMHMFVQSQKKRIDELEKTVKTLSNDLKEIKARPPVHVGTIEYKFDQLKVETLEGTLNIGLNPSDMEGIEELEVDNKNISTPFSPKEQMEAIMELENSINQYLDFNLKPLVQRYGEQLQMEVDNSYIDFIREDIKKQLPNRIEYYLKQNPVKERTPETKIKVIEKVEKQLKKDIENAIATFLNNLPKTKKD